jgi:hypothetical protein
MEPEDIAAEDVIPEDDALPPGLPKEILKEVRLRRALQKHCREYAGKLERGEIPEADADAFMAELNEIAVAHGVESGLPMPSFFDVRRPMVLARGAPLSRIPLNFNEQAQELASRNIPVRNSWHMLGDRSVCIVQTDEGPMAWPQYDAGTRLHKLMDGMLLRSGSQQTAEAELRAMESLRKRINRNQWESYVLNGAFPERSKRSDVHYIFRKGLPTIAATAHGNGKLECRQELGMDNEEQADGGLRVLACLCLHPMGYFAYTHCGLLCPTDEVICALLMMRADEWKFWQSSGQWSASDTRSGI